MTKETPMSDTTIVFFRWWNDDAGTQGVGRCPASGAITSIDDVETIEDGLCAGLGYTSVVLTGWRSFDVPA